MSINVKDIPTKVIINENNTSIGVNLTRNEVVVDENNNIVEVVTRGAQGPSGSNDIGGYPVVMSNIQPRDVVMFGANQWNNIPQTEISDGGNY